MKLTLDTNIFISGLFFPKSNAGKIVELWRQGELEMVLSEAIIKEISDVLSYPKIKKRLKWSAEEIDNYCSLLRFHCKIVDIENVKVNVPKDVKDNYILATFIAGKANFLISRDSDLLDLKDKYRILSPREFLDGVRGF